MADENDVSISIGADASAVQPGAEAAAASIAGISEAMAGVAAAMEVQTAAINKGFEALIAQSKKTAEELEEDSVMETLALKGVGAAAVQAATNLKEMKEAAFGLGELFLAAFAVHEIIEFSDKMAETAEKVMHSAETFGLTTAEVQRLQGVAAATGVPVDALMTAMQRLDKSFAAAKQGGAQQSAAFKTLGIDTNASMTQTQLLNTALAKLGEMDAGPAKVATAMAIFGRNVQGLGPILAMTAEQMAEANAAITEYGVVSDDAISKGGALAEAYNTQKLASMGLENTLTSAFAPALTTAVQGITALKAEITKSYNEGGKWKTILDDTAIAAKTVETAVVILGGALAFTTDLIVGVEKVMFAMLQPLYDGFLMLAQSVGVGLSDAFGPTGVIAVGVLKSIAEWVGKVWTVVSNFMGSLPVVGDAWKNMGKAAAETLKSITTDAGNAGKAVAAIWGPDQKVKLPKEGVGTTGDDPIAKAPKEKAEKSKMPDLEAKFDAQEAVKSNNGAVLLNMAQDEVDYWGKVKAAGDLGHNDQIAAEKKYSEALIALNKEKTQNALAEIKQQEQDDIAGVNTRLANEKAAIASEIKAVEDGEKDKTITRTQGTAMIDALILKQVQAEDAAATQILAITETALQKEAAYYAANTLEFQKNLNEQVAAKQKAADAGWKAVAEGIAKEKATQDAADAATIAEAQKTYTKIGDFARTTTEGLIEGTTTWQAAFTKALEGMLDMFLQSVERQVVAQLAGEAAKTSATQVGTADRLLIQAEGIAAGMAKEALAVITSITNFAAQAAAGAYAALAGVPVVGPELGAAASAATMADVLGDIGMVMSSAAGGWGDVPYDGAPAILHKQEMVLPASIASPLRSGIADGSIGGGGTSGGDTHIHIHAVDAQSVQRLLTQQRGTISSALQREYREGRIG